MTLTILYLNPCRRERLKAAFEVNLKILGPLFTARLVKAVENSYLPHHSLRVNYNFAMHALHVVAGLQGLAAVTIIKEAWGMKNARAAGTREQEPANIPTHPGLTPEGKRPLN